MKVIAYANGKILKRFLSIFPNDLFVAIMDKRTKDGENVEGIPVVPPSKLRNISYEKIVVFSDIYYDEIKDELCEKYEVNREDILKYSEAIHTFWHTRISAHEKKVFVKEKTDNFHIYIVSHKPCEVVENSLYNLIAVGNYEPIGKLSDKSGDSISDLNKKINECTAIYWVWKNCKADYVGFNHYRRCFYEDGKHHTYSREKEVNVFKDASLLKLETMRRLLSENDIILPKSHFSYETVIDLIRRTTNKELADDVYKKLIEIMKQKQPDYIPCLYEIMNGHMLYTCNMFITSWVIFDKYCEWLFSFLIPLAEQVDVTGYDSYSKRIVGFFAERMLTVWLVKNPLKICELEYTQIVE